MLLNGVFLWGLLGYISPSFSLASIFIHNLVNHFLSSEPSDLIPVGVSFDCFFFFLVGLLFGKLSGDIISRRSQEPY